MASKPAKYHGYEGAKVFDKTEFDKIETDKIKVSKFGKLEVSGEEESALRLHPKFAILDKIDDEELDFQEELGYAKLRYTLLKEEEEKLDSDDEDDHKMTEEDDQASKELQEEIEAKSRQYYDPEKKLFNYGRKEQLTRPVSTENEAGIEIRRKSFRRVVANFRREECNHKMDQKPKLTKSEANGLKSLQN